ncbi:MAG TPA: Uma2 family endonuclease [Planctomycetia bacterium]|jgi:Uma2 family endonuclease|nr:Uma2 family endonuclease [Planctomycetia bacterium]
MSTVVDPPRLETLADAVHALGDVPLERIVPPFGVATEEDSRRLEEGEPKRICELVDGFLVEKPMSIRESAVATMLAGYLLAYILPRKLGTVTGEQGSMRTVAGNKRIPDVAYFSWDNLPDGKFPEGRIAETPPDLAVEVLSDSNTAEEMATKRREYFRSGVRLVWEIDPDDRTAVVYTTADKGSPLAPSDFLDGGDVLPGFRIPLADIFVGLDGRPKGA